MIAQEEYDPPLPRVAEGVRAFYELNNPVYRKLAVQTARLPLVLLSIFAVAQPMTSQ